MSYLFMPAIVFQLVKGNIFTEINSMNAIFFHHIPDEQDGYFMQFTFWCKNEYIFSSIIIRLFKAVNGNTDFFDNKHTCEMFLCRYHIPGHPKQSNFIKK